jgi:hypothetical protein
VSANSVIMSAADTAAMPPAVTRLVARPPAAMFSVISIEV